MTPRPLASGRWFNVLLELALAERGGIGGDQDELRLAGADGLEGAPVPQHNLAGLDDQGKLLFC